MWKLHKAIFFAFYNISQPNFAILLVFKMLFLAIGMNFVSFTKIKI